MSNTFKWNIYIGSCLSEFDLNVDGVGPCLGLQADPTVPGHGFPGSPGVRAVQKVARVQLHPWLVGVHLHSIPRDRVLQTVDGRVHNTHNIITKQLVYYFLTMFEANLKFVNVNL